LAPHINIASWGAFGEYVMQSPDVSTALERTKKAIQYHGSMMFFDFAVSGDELAVLYKNPTAGMVGYTHFAICAAKIINTITETFFVKDQLPLRVELDMPKPGNWSVHEDLFRCPVVFNRPQIAIVYAVDLIDRQSKKLNIAQTITMADLHRASRSEAPLDLADIVREMIRIRLYSDSVDIEHVASHLGIGVRSLQRQLAAENLAFRDLVLQVRAERAMELLHETDVSVTDIAMTLGYSSAAHFTRAFKQTVGFTPSEIRSAQFGS
jgi:AraC-like DNA-binding protein